MGADCPTRHSLPFGGEWQRFTGPNGRIGGELGVRGGEWERCGCRQGRHKPQVTIARA
jgi:hypothetical protein